MFTNIQNILIANAIILVVPGLNFSVIVRNAILHGINAASWTALGITAAIMVHVLLGLFSLSIILYTYPLLFEGIKYLGCLYIIYLGTRYLYLSFKQANDLKNVAIPKSGNFKTGFMIDIFNPFVSIFYISIFSPMVNKDISNFEYFVCVVCIAMLTFFWFAFVGIFFSRDQIRKLLIKRQAWIQRISGSLMYYFAYKLFASSL